VDVQESGGDAALPVVHVGRQPIVDREGDVVAYELLFRDAVDATRASVRGAQATSQVIVSAFTDFGLEQLAGSRACFINVTREFLVGDLPIPFDIGQAVLEIVESVDIDDAVVAGAGRLIELGFTISLDGFTLGRQERLLPLATYAKIDFLGANPAAIDAAVRRCREFPHVELIAARLETQEDLRYAFDAGFVLFQGNILGRPHILSAVGIAPGQLQRLQLLGALSSSDTDFEQVVSLVSRDAALTYRLLQACNSAASGLSARISSVREAAVLLGLKRVREWVLLMSISELTEAGEEQIALVLTRARACQTVAGQRGLSPDVAFTTGLLSGLADLIGRPAAELAGHLPLTADVHQALSDSAGELGALIDAVREYELGNASALARLISPDDAVRTYLGAVAWSTHLAEATDAETGSARSRKTFTDLVKKDR
jgi:EAL and modified HD-GYP domain-containing signal transduction protein